MIDCFRHTAVISNLLQLPFSYVDIRTSLSIIRLILGSFFTDDIQREVMHPRHMGSRGCHRFDISSCYIKIMLLAVDWRSENNNREKERSQVKGTYLQQRYLLLNGGRNGMLLLGRRKL